MNINGAKAILYSLANQGVELLFGYPGGAIMPTYDALYSMKEKLRHVLVRHEQGAIHAAVGYARATGKVGVCIATSGPGATNLITGIADAMLDSVPVVCIVGQVATDYLGTDAFQEADIIGMTVPVTKWNYQITCAKEIPAAIAKAFRVAASGRPGPVLLDITKDAQVECFAYRQPDDVAAKKKMQRQAVPDEAIKQAAALINQAKKPYLLVGHGVLISGAQAALKQLAEKADMPVASTLLGLSAFPSGHRLFKGMLGMHGNYAANMLSNEADVILAVGMRFDDRVTGNLKEYIKQAKVIHIDIDQAEIDKNVASCVAIEADAKQALQALLPHVAHHQHSQWHQQFSSHYKLEYERVIQDEIHPHEGQIKMAEVVHMLSEKTEGKALLITDVGQHQMVAARYYQFDQPNSHITSGGLGTMGFALPAAIGAKLGAMQRDVVAIAGDGGIQMNIQELAVVAQEKLPLKIIILNNSYLGMVRQWQELFFEKRYAFTALENPDFVAIAHAYGLRASKVTARGQLSSAMDVFLNTPGAYLLEVAVQTQENIFPMVPSGASVSETRLS